MDATSSPASLTPSKFSVRVFGVGDAGIAAAHLLLADWQDLAGFIGINTDDAVFGRCPLPEQVVLGQNLARRLLGGNAELAAAAAQTDAARLRSLCTGMDLILVVAGLGGGAGSGITPVLARLARESSVPLLAFVTLPFSWEGSRRQQQAIQSLHDLKQFAEGVVCLPNEKIARGLDPRTSLLDAFAATQTMLGHVVRAVGRLLLRPGHVHINFSDLCAVLKGQPAHMFFLSAEAAGSERAVQVLEQLQGQAGAGAPSGNLLADSRAILVSIVGPRDLSMAEVDQLMARVKSWAPGATVMLGAGIDEQSDRLSCTLLASEYAPLAAGGGPNRPANEPAIPIEFDTQFYPASANRPASRFVPPPPELTPDAAEQLLARQSGNTSMHRKTNGRLRQAQLPLEVVSKGRFEKSEPTIRHGEDLDVPTFIRRGLVLP